jgi:hypothetical protein
MLLSLTVSLLPLVAVSVSAAPAPAPATSSANYGNLPAGWQSASDSLIMDNINSQRVLTGQNQGVSILRTQPTSTFSLLPLAIHVYTDLGLNDPLCLSFQPGLYLRRLSREVRPVLRVSRMASRRSRVRRRGQFALRSL